jgi:hypothetical protein
VLGAIRVFDQAGQRLDAGPPFHPGGKGSPLEVEPEPQPERQLDTASVPPRVVAHAGAAGESAASGEHQSFDVGDRDGDGPDHDAEGPVTMEELLEDEHLELTRLRRSVLAEVVLGVVVLAVTAMLVNAAPAISLENAPYLKTITAGQHYYDLIVSPAKTGPNQVQFTTSTFAGGPAPVLGMTIAFDNPGKGIAPINVPLLRLAPGHYASYSFQLPFAGTWRMTVKALFSQVDETTFSTNVRIR